MYEVISFIALKYVYRVIDIFSLFSSAHGGTSTHSLSKNEKIAFAQ